MAFSLGLSPLWSWRFLCLVLLLKALFSGPFLFFVYAFILQGTSSNNSLRKSAWEVSCLRPCTSKTSSFYSHALIEMWVRCSFLIEFWKHCSIFFCLPEMLLKSPMLLSLHLRYVSCLSLCGLLESSLVLKVYDDVSNLRTVYIHVLSLVGPFNLEQWWHLWPSLCFMATSGLPLFLWIKFYWHTAKDLFVCFLYNINIFPEYIWC